MSALLTALLLGAAAFRSAFPIPPSAYPPGAYTALHAHVSNAAMDSQWGIGFHSRTEAQLGRVAGWAAVEWTQDNRGLLMWASTYRTPLEAQSAAGDITSRLMGYGYTASPHHWGGWVGHEAGHVTMMLIRMHGCHEVEAVATFAERSGWYRPAWRYLEAQTRAVL